MSTHEHTIVVDRPLPLVYRQWAEFEDYPEFMPNVRTVQRLGPALTHWRVRVGGIEREYDAVITEQRRDKVIAWHTVEGPDQGGRVSFVPLGPDHTRITLQMNFAPEGLTENLGDTFGVVSASVEHSLEKFKQFIEADRSGSAGTAGTRRPAEQWPVQQDGDLTEDPRQPRPPGYRPEATPLFPTDRPGSLDYPDEPFS